MAIRVHYGDPGILGQAAEAAGTAGATRQNTLASLEARQRAAMQAASLSAQAAGQQRSMAFSGQQRAADRADAWDVRQWGAGQQAQQQQMEQYGRQQMFEQQQAAQLQQMEQQEQWKRDNFDYELTARQKQRFERNNEALQTIADLEQQGSIDKDQAAFMRFNVTAANESIQPVPVPKKRAPTPAEILQNNMAPLNDGSGRSLLVQPDGSFSIEMPPQDTEKNKRDKLLFDQQQAEVEQRASVQKTTVDFAKEIYLRSIENDDPVDPADAYMRAKALMGSMNFNSLEEAEAANLPDGTIIYIQGRRAIVE